jgi:16S rRNA (adenine1518-N6/adenine1519-N6)-dimethyltransferase
MLLQERGLSPRHRLGQNFLHDHNILSKLVDASDVQTGDLVLEIGPGTGSLTEELLERGCEVVACELDRGLVGLLHDRFGDSISLIEGDCLTKKQLHPEVVERLAGRPWRLVSNLPYQIASPLLVTLLTSHPECLGSVVTIQHEVAQRLMAQVDTKAWGVLSILVQRIAEVSLVTKVPNTCFWPQPKVTSACVKVVPEAKRKSQDNEEFGKFVTSLFSNRRKQLGSILGRDHKFPKSISADARPSTLPIKQLELLYESVRTSKD